MGLIGSIVGSVASLGGGIASAITLNRGYRQQQDLYDQRMSDIKAHRDNVYYRDPAKSAENQAAVTEARELLAEQAKAAEAKKAVTGGTDEAVAMQKAAGTEAVGKMLQKQAALGDAKKEAVWQSADQELDAFTKYLAASKLEKAKSNAAAITDAAGKLSEAAQKLDFGGSIW